MLSASNANFMLADVFGVGVAFVLFSFLTVLPGYTVGWAFNVLRFRTRAMTVRLAISVPVAIAIGPVVSYLLGRSVSLSAVCVLYAVLSLVALPLIFLARQRRFSIWLVPVWCMIALIALCDLQLGHRLYFSVIGFDYAVRTAFVASISTFGLPAQNPFFFPGEPVALRYHYYWLIQSALVHKVASPLVSARHCLIAGTLWCGAGLISTLFLYLRLFRINVNVSLRRVTLCGAALLAVTGLDIIPALFFLALFKSGLVGAVPPSMEWWNDQVDGWLYSMLWEPHYVAGLIACLFGFLVISRESARRRASVGILAGLAFATAVGAAIYVAFVFAAFLMCWSVVVLAKRWYGELLCLAVAGLTALVSSLPFLAGLRGPGSGGALLHLTVRPFFVVDVLSKFLNVNQPWQVHLANLVLLPMNYFMELGVFFAVGIWEWRRIRKIGAVSRNDLALIVMALASVTVCTFLGSGVIANNDLGWRGFLIAQFVLLVRGAQWLSSGGLKSKGVWVLVSLGATGTVYDQTLLRFYPVLSDAKVLPKVAWLARDEQVGDRTYDNREAYEWLIAHSKPESTVQQNPNPVVQDSFYGLYADRRTLAEDIQCAATFGGNIKDCDRLQRIIGPLFGSGSTPDTLRLACAALPMDFVVVKDTDAVWGGEDNWIWHRRPVFANRFVRVFQCSQ